MHGDGKQCDGLSAKGCLIMADVYIGGVGDLRYVHNGKDDDFRTPVYMSAADGTFHCSMHAGDSIPRFGIGTYFSSEANAVNAARLFGHNVITDEPGTGKTP